MLNITFETINNLIENNSQLAVQYLTNVKNAGSTHCTQSFKNKASAFFNSVTEYKNYIQSNLKNVLINKYKNYINITKNNLEIIKFNSFIKKYINKLPFTENHLRIIDILFSRIDKYFSNELFNNTYLERIENFINNKSNVLNQIEINLNNLYNSVKNLAYSSSTSYDYYRLRVDCYKVCSKKIFGKCVSHNTECNNYYDGYKVGGTNNYLYLKSINFTDYSKNYDLLYNTINSNILNNSILYNNTLNIYQNNLNIIKSNILSNTSKYLFNITGKISNFIKDEISNNLNLLSYYYFQNEIKNKLIS